MQLRESSIGCRVGLTGRFRGNVALRALDRMGFERELQGVIAPEFRRGDHVSSE